MGEGGWVRQLPRLRASVAANRSQGAAALCIRDGHLSDSSRISRAEARSLLMII